MPSGPTTTLPLTICRPPARRTPHTSSRRYSRHAQPAPLPHTFDQQPPACMTPSPHLCGQVVPFPQQELQAKLVARCLSGRARLPSVDAMKV
eukprot:365349-Chlamydomonas_euryale.AAC.7